MGSYTVVSFTLPKGKSIKHFKRAIKWDVWSVKEKISSGHIYHELSIGELSFKESLFILDPLKKEFSVQFNIEHGVY